MKKKIVQADQKGELCLSGQQVTDSYWENIDKTQSSFVKLDNSDDIYYKTGDVVSLNHNGDYVFYGRTDNQVKIDGHRVELAEIEYVVSKYTNQSFVAAVLSAEENPVLKLFLIDGSCDKKELIHFMKTKLPEYMIPREVTLINEFPLNTNGKIDRNKLASM